MRAEIAVAATGRGSIKLDGVDVSDGVRAFDLHTTANRRARLTLDLNVRHPALLDVADADVVVAPATAAVLELLGWTPPPTLAEIAARTAAAAGVDQEVPPPVSKVSVATHGIAVNVEAAAPLHEVQATANRLHVDAVGRAPARSRPVGFDR